MQIKTKELITHLWDFEYETWERRWIWNLRHMLMCLAQLFAFGRGLKVSIKLVQILWSHQLLYRLFFLKNDRDLGFPVLHLARINLSFTLRLNDPTWQMEEAVLHYWKRKTLNYFGIGNLINLGTPSLSKLTQNELRLFDMEHLTYLAIFKPRLYGPQSGML